MNAQSEYYEQLSKKLRQIAFALPQFEAEDLQLLDQIVQKYTEIRLMMRSEFLPNVESRGEAYVVELAQICIDIGLPNLAELVVSYCIDTEMLGSDESKMGRLHQAIVSLILAFGLDRFVDIERQSERVRLRHGQGNIGLPLRILLGSESIGLIELLHRRILRELTASATISDESDDIQIEKYNNLISIIRRIGKQNQQLLLDTRWAKLYAFESLEFSEGNSRALFPQQISIGADLYDEMLRRNFGILLFPAIGNIQIANGQIQVTNEGKGSFLDPRVAFSQHGIEVLQIGIRDVVSAGGIATFRLNTMEQRLLMALDPNIKELRLLMRYRKFGRAFELHRSVRTEDIIDGLRPATGEEVIPVGNSEDLRDLVEYFFSVKIRHRVEQDEGYKTLTESGNGDRKLRDEKDIQVTLKHWLEDLCQPYGIDINRETQTGRGPVDFKFSIGEAIKCVVEVKLWDNRLEHGLSTQLPTYLQSEKAHYGLFVVVVTSEQAYQERIDNLVAEMAKLNATGHFEIRLVEIQAWKRPSASKAKSYDDPSRYLHQSIR
jgi:hypothetical protein